MTVVFLLAAVLVVCGIAIAATGRGGGLAAPSVDRPEPQLPAEPLTADDVHDLRFALALRGYRMDQVDAVLDRLASELARRDEELTRLRERCAAARHPAT